MHELSIATGIIELIESNVADPATVTKVALTTSHLSGISEDALNFSFSELCKLKGYTHAVLHITTVPVLMKCAHCKTEYQCLVFDTFCPQCGKPERDILSIPPFKIDYIETAEP